METIYTDVVVLEQLKRHKLCKESPKCPFPLQESIFAEVTCKRLTQHHRTAVWMAPAAPCLYLGAFVTLKPSLPTEFCSRPLVTKQEERVPVWVAGAGAQVVPPTGSAPRAFMDPLRAAARP